MQKQLLSQSSPSIDHQHHFAAAALNTKLGGLTASLLLGCIVLRRNDVCLLSKKKIRFFNGPEITR